jgi:hypothetical protein
VLVFFQKPGTNRQGSPLISKNLARTELKAEAAQANNEDKGAAQPGRY